MSINDLPFSPFSWNPLINNSSAENCWAPGPPSPPWLVIGLILYRWNNYLYPLDNCHTTWPLIFKLNLSNKLCFTFLSMIPELSLLSFTVLYTTLPLTFKIIWMPSVCRIHVLTTSGDLFHISSINWPWPCSFLMMSWAQQSEFRLKIYMPVFSSGFPSKGI